MCDTEKAGRLAACVLSLLCWALLPVNVKMDSVMTNNGDMQSNQNVSRSDIHESYRCMYCHKAEHIIDCLDVITCAPHEVCYIEKEMLGSGWPVINAGCRSRHTCNLKTCFGESMHGYSHAANKRSTLSCHHCCEGEFCNLYGCPDSEDMSVLPSSRCMACDAVKDPVLCDKMINCPYSQQCVSYGVFHAGGLRFELGCEETTYCNAFKNNSNVKRDVNHHDGEIDLASTCCDTHLCNRNWPPQDQPPPKVISGFTCNHMTERPSLSSIIGMSSTSPTVASRGPSQSPTHTPITSTPNITIPTSENCKDRATENNCNYLNITNQLCDTITLTSVYYCVKFCGFCSPSPTAVHPTSSIPMLSSSPTLSSPVFPATQSTPVSHRTSSAPTAQKSTMEPFNPRRTSGPTTSAPDITIPSGENCTDRAAESACDYLNKTSQLCDTITITSVYYCVKFCRFCTPLSTSPSRQGPTTPIVGTVTTPISPPLATRPDRQRQTTPTAGTVTTPVSPPLSTSPSRQGPTTPIVGTVTTPISPPLATRPDRQGQTTPTAGTVTTPVSPPLATNSDRIGQTTPTAGTVTTPVSKATVSTSLPQNIPILVGKRLNDDYVGDTDH